MKSCRTSNNGLQSHPTKCSLAVQSEESSDRTANGGNMGVKDASEQTHFAGGWRAKSKVRSRGGAAVPLFLLSPNTRRQLIS